MKVTMYTVVFMALLAMSQASTECPAEDGEFTVHLRNPADCSSFYKCSNGIAYLTACPSGLEWNEELGVCDWPENAKCHTLTECPAEDGEFAVHLSNPADCSSFYKCSNGVPHLMSCPHGLEWNQQLEICDWPENANCVASAAAEGETEAATKEEAEEEATEKSEEQATEKTKEETDSHTLTECPAEDGEFTVHLPNPADCSRFYKCSNGVAHVLSCPDGLEWNQKIEVCDWPENANCVVSDVAEEETEEETTTEAQEETNEESEEEAKKNTEEEAEDEAEEEAEEETDGPILTECPAEDGDLTVHLPNSADCSSFYKCSNGVPYLLSCPASLEWNQKLEVCDWPENANCVVSAATEEGTEEETTEKAEEEVQEEAEEEATEEGTEEETTEKAVEEVQEEAEEEATEETEKETDGRSLTECPTEDGELAVHLANPANCSSFYKCSNGIAHLQECPLGLEWNEELETCDWPENANCVVSTTA